MCCRSKVKTLAALQDKMAALESNLDALATALKNRPRHDEKIATLQDKLATVERNQASFTDMKAVETFLNIRLPREFHDVEGRMSQTIAFVAEKVEAKLHSMDKSLQSQRAESMAALKSELVEDIQRLSSSSLRKSDVVPLQNAHAQLKEDLAQLSVLFERQDKRIQDFKHSSTQIRDEITETKQELTRVLHAQQSRVSTSLEEKLAQLSAMSKEKSGKVDQQMAALSKKQKKVEESARALQDDIAKVRQDVFRKQDASHALQQKENEKLRQRLARSVAELETLTLAKEDVEKRYGKKEKQLQAKLKALNSKLEVSERLKEAERLELVQRIQEETKLMGIAQGKTALLESLLAKEKLQSAEKNELLHKSRQEMNLVRQKMRAIESEGELKMHKLASELHSKQLQVDTLLKKLKKSEEEATKLLEASKRDAKAARRAKVAKEHQLAIAKLKLKELESAATTLALQLNGVNGSTQSAVSIAMIEEADAKRKVTEELLLESQLQVEELTQEMDEIRKEYDAASSNQRALLDDQMAALSSEYELKIAALNAAVAAKDQAMARLRDTLVEKSELNAVDEELRALKDEKLALVATLDRTRSEHASAIHEQDSKTRRLHEQEMDAIKRSLEAKAEEVEDARADIVRLKASVSKLETDIRETEGSHADEVAALTEEMQGVRSQIAVCAIEAETLRAEKAELEHELERVQFELEQLQSDANDSEAELSEKLAEQEAEMQRQIDEVLRRLDEKECELADCKSSDDTSRRKLLEMVSEQEEMERRLKSEIDALLLALERERESSNARAQELESAISTMRDELELMKLESEQTATSHQSAMAGEVAQVTNALNESLRREQHLQDRLVGIVRGIVRAASDFDADAQVEVTGAEADDALAAKYLTHFSATQRGIVVELESLQAESETAAKQAAEDAATIKALDAQVKLYRSQIDELESVVKQLESDLKDLYAKSATQSEDLEQEITLLKKQKSKLERVVESKASECEEKQAAFDRQLETKVHQTEALRSENEKMSATIASIRRKMENIETSKARELDEMSAALSEIELRAAMHTGKSHESAHADLDKDFYASHHESVALAQSIRSLQLKLTKSVGIVEWNDLRASVFAEEDKLERLLQEKTREVRKIGSAEEEILLNADFLKAVLTLSDSGGAAERDVWISKYAQCAPEMVEKLKRLEARLQDAISEQHASAMTNAADLARLRSQAGAGASSRSASASFDDEIQHASLQRRLPESRDSEDFVLESREDIREQQELDDEERDDSDDGNDMSMQESLDESSMLSESAVLDESSLDTSLKTDEREQSGGESCDDANSSLSDKHYASDSREVVDSCARLAVINTPSELLSAAFVPSSARGEEMGPANAKVKAVAIANGETHAEADDNADEFDEDEEAGGREDDDHDIDSEGSEDEEQIDDASDSELEQSTDVPSHELSSARLGDDLEEFVELEKESRTAISTPATEDASHEPEWGDSIAAVASNEYQCEDEAVHVHETSDASAERRHLAERVQTLDGVADSESVSIELDVSRAADVSEPPLDVEDDSASQDHEPDQSRSDRGSFVSHESDDENLAEFDAVPTQRRESCESEDDEDDSSDARDVAVEGNAQVVHDDAANAYTNRMEEEDDDDEAEVEEEEADDEDGMEAVERMLLAGSHGADSGFEAAERRLFQAMTHSGVEAEQQLLRVAVDADDDRPSNVHRPVTDDAVDSEGSMESFGDDDTADEASGSEEVPVQQTPLSVATDNDKRLASDFDDEEEEHDKAVEDSNGERAMDVAQTDASFSPVRVAASFDDRTPTRTTLEREGEDESDEDLDEVERLMREQSGFNGQRRTTPATRETSASHANLSDNDDELIDSESEEEHESAEHPLDAHADDDLAQDLHSSHDTHATTRTRPSSDQHEAHEERLEASSDDEGSSQAESIDGDAADSVDEATTLPIYQLDANVSARAPSTMLSGAPNDILSRPKPNAEQSQDEDGSDEDGEFGFGSRQPELTLPAVPTKLLPSTLAPLGTSSSLSGAGALKKALSAARRDFDEDDEDDMDEVERLVVAQSFTRASPFTSSRASSAVHAKKTLGKMNYSHDDDDGDDSEYGAIESSLTSKTSRVAMRSRHEDDEFEEHELGGSPHDEHDDSFDDLRDRTDTQLGDLDSEGEAQSGDEESSSQGTRPSLDRQSGAQQQQLEFAFGQRGVALAEEDDDMDEVERLLFEQASTKHIASVNSAPAPVAQYAVVDEEASCDDESADDEEHVVARPFTAAKHSIVSHDLDGEQRSDDADESAMEESLDASSQQESSFEDGDRTAADCAPSEDSCDEQTMMRVSSDLTQRQQRERGGRVNTNTAVSDSSDSEDDEEDVSSRDGREGATAARHTLTPLQLTKSATSLSLGQRQLGGLEEDDDMDEVERLLAAQTSMKNHPLASHRPPNTANCEFDDEEDDEFGENSLEASASSATGESPLRHVRAEPGAERAPVAAKRCDHNDDDDGDIDGDSSEDGDPRSASYSRRSSGGSSSDPIASPNAATRIPIFNGSSLADRVAMDAIPSMLSGAQPLSTVGNEIQQQRVNLAPSASGDVDADEIDEEEEDYMEESFDLEESMQEDEDE